MVDTSRRPAGVVAFVKDEEDVAAAIKFATDAKLEIAIKGESLQLLLLKKKLMEIGGGHNPSGASSTNGGLVIDLSKYLNKITVDPIAKIAHVQGGALWSEVDDATCSFGLATVAGTLASVSPSIVQVHEQADNQTGVGG
jgi:FAD/FMN-containing dehydrogenase